MALEYLDGFSTYSSAQVLRFYPSMQANVPIIANNSLLLRNSYYPATTGLIGLTTRNEYMFGFDLSINSGSRFFVIDLEVGSIVISCLNDGTITSPYGNSVLGSMAYGVVQNIQIKLVISATNGSFMLRKNGVTLIDINGINTGIKNIIAFELAVDGSISGTYSNLWVFNNLGTHSNILPTGRMRIQPQFPNAEGNYLEMTPNSGTVHYNRINETPADDDVTYNSNVNVGERDTYKLSPLSGDVYRVHGVKIISVLRKDIIDIKTAHILALSAATLVEGSDIDVPLTYTPNFLYLKDDPATNAQWLQVNVNNLQPGNKVVL